MNPYDRHQLTARELQSERTPPAYEMIFSACLMLAGILSVLIVTFNI